MPPHTLKSPPPQAAPDDDNPEWTADDFAHSQLPESLPAEVLANFPKTIARIGRPPSEASKVPVKLRLDPDVVAAYKADGPGWQTRMNADLKEAAQRRVRA